MKSISRLLLVILVIGMVSIPAMADKHGKIGCSSKQAMHDCGSCAVYAKLNLTKEQQAKIDELQKTRMTKRNEYLKQMKDYREKMHTMMTAADIDREQIHKMIDEKSKLQAEWKKYSVDHREAILSLMNDEQKKIWNEHHSNMKGNCGKSGCKSGCGKHMPGKMN